MGSSETLYSAVGSLHLSAEWTLLDYLRAIRELATGLGAYEACVQPSHNGDGGKADDHVLKVSRLMR